MRARKERAAPDDTERREAALRLADVGVNFCAPWRDLVIAGYYPVRGEIDCLPLLDALAREGQKLALPVTREDGMLDFVSWTPGDRLLPGRFNIPCPADGTLATPDVLLIPLLAFDSHGFRLGYGGGCYDRTLARLRTTRPAETARKTVAIGIAFDFQEAPELPSEAHDQRLDWVLTPSSARRLGV